MNLIPLLRLFFFLFVLSAVASCGTKSDSMPFENSHQKFSKDSSVDEEQKKLDSLLELEEAVDLPPNPDKDLYLPKEVSPLSVSNTQAREN